LRRRLAAVRDPRHAPPALVDVSVRVDEAGQGEKPAAVDPLRRRPRARRHHARDLIAIDQDVCGGSAQGRTFSTTIVMGKWYTKCCAFRTPEIRIAPRASGSTGSARFVEPGGIDRKSVV